MRIFWHDIRMGIRSLMRTPGLALVAIVALALGIGANTAIFSVVDAVLLRPLPYPQPNRLVAIYTTDAQHGGFNGRFTYRMYQQLQPTVEPLGKLAGYTPWPFTITRPGEPKDILGTVASPSFFSVIAAHPLLGRLFTPADGEQSRPVALLGEHIWRTRFDADPGILGKTIELEHHAFQIVGVVPASLRLPMLPASPDVWIPLSPGNLSQALGAVSGSLQGAMPSIKASDIDPDNLSVLNVMVRLRDGATVAQVNAAAEAVMRHAVGQNPHQYAGAGVRSALLAQELERSYRTALLLLLGAVGLVLLIACANVANLMVARMTSRAREMALRLALGAGKGQIVRQMLIESVELSLAGGAAGCYLAYLVVNNLGHWVPQSLDQARAATLNGHVLVFAAAISLGAGILFGAFPVWGIADLKAFSTLKEGGRGLSGAGSGLRLRNGLAVVEVALAVILLVGAGLLLHSFVRAISVNPGYDPHGLLVAQLTLPVRDYPKPDQLRNFVTNAIAHLRAEPGISAVAAAVTPPVAREQFGLGATYEVVGHPLPPERQPMASLLPVSPGYFLVMRTPLIRGRDFTDADGQGSARVCIVSKSLASQEFGVTDPIGQRLTFPDTGIGCEIVGEAGDELHGSPTSVPQPSIYFPFAQFPISEVSFLIRTSVTPDSAKPAAQSALREVGPGLPIDSVDTVEQLLRHTMEQERLRTLLVGMFAGLAILLAAVGISGVLGYSVSRRTQEIGVRMALGATPAEVLRQVVSEGLRLVGIGALLGIGAALGLTRFMRSLLYGIGTGDLLTYTAVAVVLLLVAAVACALPALRAARVDPTVALRYE